MGGHRLVFLTPTLIPGARREAFGRRPNVPAMGVGTGTAPRAEALSTIQPRPVIRYALGDKFPKHIYHLIICIGALIVHQQD